MTLRFLFADIMQMRQMNCLLRLKHYRWEMCGVRTDRSEEDFASLCSVTLIF